MTIKCCKIALERNMKRFFGALLICGFLAGSIAQAAPADQAGQRKAALKRAKKAQKKNAKARKAAKRKVVRKA